MRDYQNGSDRVQHCYLMLVLRQITLSENVRMRFPLPVLRVDCALSNRTETNREEASAKHARKANPPACKLHAVKVVMQRPCCIAMTNGLSPV